MPAVLQGCQPDCPHGGRRGRRRDTHPDQPKGSCTRQRSVVEDGKALLELRVLAGAVREECPVC